jgi:hypothetical protein
MKAMNSPMPTPIAFLSAMGMASITASRSPVTTSTVMTRPSSTIRPIASGQVRCWLATKVKATTPFRPSPAAIAKG